MSTAGGFGKRVDTPGQMVYTGLVTRKSLFGNSMLAIIKTGGKQYKVAVGDKIKIEKLEGEAGAVITFDEVLFIGDETDAKIGTPFIEGAKVEGTLVEQGRHKKVWGIKHKAKKRYKVKFGHKQLFTEVEITKIA
jgi:large subunit ribosomal protein L21